MSLRIPRERSNAVIADLKNVNGKRHATGEPIIGGSLTARANVASVFANVTNKRTRVTDTVAATELSLKKAPLVEEVVKKSAVPVKHAKDEKLSREERAAMKEAAKKEHSAWQTKYRIAMRDFVFFFDRLEPSMELQLTKEIEKWGARTDQFFSRSISHVVTSRNIPNLTSAPPNALHELAAPRNSPKKQRLSPHKGLANCKENLKISCTKAPRSKAAATPKLKSPNGTERNPFLVDSTPAHDSFLLKALTMPCKVWRIEKLQNVLSRLPESKSPVKAMVHAKPLSTLLKDEARQGYTHERDIRVPRSDFYYFPLKSYFLLVEDSTGEHRPIYAKEYDKPKELVDASWPVLWGGMEGKPAFAHYALSTTYRSVRDRIDRQINMQKKVVVEQRIGEPPTLDREMVVEGCDDNLSSDELQIVDADDQIVQTAGQLLPPAQIGSPRFLRKSISMMHMTRSKSALGGGLRKRSPLCDLPDDGSTLVKNAADHIRGPRNVFLAASGNSVSITSNIASATSTTGMPSRGRHVVPDKKLAELERRTNFQSTRLNDDADTFKKPINPALARLQGGANRLKRTQSMNDFAACEERKGVAKKQSRVKGLGVRAKLAALQVVDLVKIAKVEDIKPGYCENCRLKYDDFRAHVASRKHRKWARNEDNWVELDELLQTTTRLTKAGRRLPQYGNYAHWHLSSEDSDSKPSTPPQDEAGDDDKLEHGVEDCDDEDERNRRLREEEEDYENGLFYNDEDGLVPDDVEFEDEDGENSYVEEFENEF